jgi:hypothetical protein
MKDGGEANEVKARLSSRTSTRERARLQDRAREWRLSVKPAATTNRLVGVRTDGSMASELAAPMVGSYLDSTMF